MGWGRDEFSDPHPFSIPMKSRLAVIPRPTVCHYFAKKVGISFPASAFPATFPSLTAA